MRARIVRIGNSKGIRLPKPLLDQTGISGEVDLSVDGNRIIIRGVSEPRAGWEAAFHTMAPAGDDEPPGGGDNLSTDWDDTEWIWS